jgi:hypothetical protein
MAPDRMAKEGIGTDQILALQVAGRDLTEVSGEDGQTRWIIERDYEELKPR